MSNAQVIKPPHTLRKAKIGAGPAKLDPALIERAEQAMARMEKDYMVWAQEDLANLEDAFKKLRQGAGVQADEIRRLYSTSLDMKGQGGSFGYLLITAVADSLTDFLEERTGFEPFDYEVIAAHIGAMRAVFNDAVRDDGGQTGQLLMAELFRLKQKAAS